MAACGAASIEGQPASFAAVVRATAVLAARRWHPATDLMLAQQCVPVTGPTTFSCHGAAVPAAAAACHGAAAAVAATTTVRLNAAFHPILLCNMVCT